MNRKIFLTFTALALGLFFFSKKETATKAEITNKLKEKRMNFSKKNPPKREIAQEVKKTPMDILKKPEIEIVTMKDIIKKYNIKEDTEYSFQKEISYLPSGSFKSVPESKFTEDMGKIVKKSHGFIEYTPTKKGDKGFPIVMNKHTAEIGYITGDVIVSKNNFDKTMHPNAVIMADDSDLDIYYLKVNKMEEIVSLINDYKDNKFFEVVVVTALYETN